MAAALLSVGYFVSLATNMIRMGVNYASVGPEHHNPKTQEHLVVPNQNSLKVDHSMDSSFHRHL